MQNQTAQIAPLCDQVAEIVTPLPQERGARGAGLARAGNEGGASCSGDDVVWPPGTPADAPAIGVDQCVDTARGIDMNAER